MYYSGFQNNAFQRNAFQILINALAPTPQTKGGFKKHNKSFKHSVKDSLADLFAEPKAVEQVKDIIEPYSNSKNITLSSIDIKQLAKNVEAAERIINLAMEMQREREDEEAILLLM